MQGGRGSPVVFIHGLGSSSYMEWRYTLEPTAARHRVFAPDLPGYGRTEKPRARYTIPYFPRFVESYMEDRGLRSAVIVGASLGGRTALEAAPEQPRLARNLSLVNALDLSAPQLRSALTGAARRSVSEREGRAHNPRLVRPGACNPVCSAFLSPGRPTTKAVHRSGTPGVRGRPARATGPPGPPSPASPLQADPA